MYRLARHLNVPNMSDEATFDARQEANWKQQQGSEYDIRRPVTRKEFAVLLDTVVNPFELYSVSMKGELGE